VEDDRLDPLGLTMELGVSSESPPSGPAIPGGNVASLVWQAMRGAADGRVAGAKRGACDDEVAESLPSLWDAVWQAAAGQEPRLVAAPPVNARQLLDNVRRSFVELMRSVRQPVDVQEVFRVLDAIERVQCVLERDAIQSFREQTAGPSGMELLVEVAHDLRSPLTSILFLAETLRAGRGKALEPVQERQLKLIYSAAFELSSLANDLTELAQGGEQLLEREPVPFAIGNVLASVGDIVQPIAEEKNLEVRLESSAADRRLGHPAALGRVLLNLVTNALRCTDKGFVEATAHNLSPTRVEFSVRDSGPGVPDEVIASLFKPFDPQKLAGSRAFSSSGLGLAICRRLVTAMGGDLRVKSAEDRGSCFYFALELPLDPTAEPVIVDTFEPGGCADFEEVPLVESRPDRAD
jgi:signal transduction histidine kinase